MDRRSRRNWRHNMRCEQSGPADSMLLRCLHSLWLAAGLAAVTGVAVSEAAQAETPLGLSAAVHGGDQIAMAQACANLAAGAHVCSTLEVAQMTRPPNLPIGPWTGLALPEVVHGVSTGADMRVVDAVGLAGGPASCVLVNRSASGAMEMQIGACGLLPAVCCGILAERLFSDGFEGT